jgi:cytochrome b
MHLPMPVWDVPVRLFHWLLVAFGVLSYLSYRNGHMAVHVISGHAILALLIFRIVWGVVGSDTARLSRLLRSPRAVFEDLAGFFRREPDRAVGHNAAGGWMVALLLVLIAAQVGSGLCANDGVLTEGPLAKYVGQEMSDRLAHVHAVNFKVLLTAVGIHVLAVAGHALFKGQNLVRPMITGRKRLPAATPAPRMVSSSLGLGVLLAAAAAAYAVATLL